MPQPGSAALFGKKRIIVGSGLGLELRLFEAERMIIGWITRKALKIRYGMKGSARLSGAACCRPCSRPTWPLDMQKHPNKYELRSSELSCLCNSTYNSKSCTNEWHCKAAALAELPKHAAPPVSAALFSLGPSAQQPQHCVLPESEHLRRGFCLKCPHGLASQLQLSVAC